MKSEVFVPMFQTVVLSSAGNDSVQVDEDICYDMDDNDDQLGAADLEALDAAEDIKPSITKEQKVPFTADILYRVVMPLTSMH